MKSTSAQVQGAVAQRLEPRTLFTGAPAELEINLAAQALPAYGFNESAEAGGVVYASAQRDAETEVLFAGNGAAAATRVFVSSKSGYKTNQGVSGLTDYHGQLYFLANFDSVSGNGLYVSNGTVAGTTLVRRLGGDTTRFSAKSFVLNDRIYFFTHEGPFSKLTMTDGTDVGTSDVWSVTDSGSVPQPSAIINGQVFFSVNGAVWRTDGSVGGTVQVWSGADPSATASDFVLAGGHIFFQYTTSTIQRLYVIASDGSGATKLTLPGTTAQSETGLFSAPVAAGNRAVFLLSNNQIVASDGTDAGTVRVDSGTFLNQSKPVPASNGIAVFYRQASSASQAGWWATDGTAAGTQRILAGKTGSGGSYDTFSYDGRAYLRTETGEIGMYVFQSDGTAAGTRTIHYLAPAQVFRNYFSLPTSSLNGRWTMGGVGVGGPQLWSFDPDVPTGSITGITYNDVNHNGTRQGFESLLSSKAYIDINHNQVFDAADPVRSATDGNPYFFDGLTPGQYDIRVVTGNNAPVTTESPASGVQQIDLQGGQHITANFILPRAAGGVIWGNVFDDANGNLSRDPSEAGVSGTVFLDTNDNKVFDTGERSANIASDGTYGFSGVAPGTYIVRRHEATGWEQTSPPRRTAVNVTVTADEVLQVDFPLAAVIPGSITGFVWTDWNHDGVRDSGDTPRSNTLVYLDVSGDGLFESDEPAATTNSAGKFTFVKVNPGQEMVRLRTNGTTLTQSSPAGNGGFAVTMTSGVSISPGEFLAYDSSETPPVARISGRLWFDADGDGIEDAGETSLSGRTIYMDADSSGTLNDGDSFAVTDASGNYSFDHRRAGTYLLRQIIPADWEQTAPAGGGARSVLLAASQQLAGIDLGSRPVLSASVSQGMLIVTGTGAGDHFTFSADATNFIVTREGSVKSFPLSAITSVAVDGLAGSDSYEIDAALPVPLQIAGTSGEALIFGAGHNALAANAVSGWAGAGVTVAAGAELDVASAATVASLAVAGDLSIVGAAITLVTKSLDVTGALDLGTGSMIIDYGPSASPIGSWGGGSYTGATGAIQSGRNGGAWTGDGVVTSSASGNLTSVGVAEASQALGISGTQTAVFAGQTIDATSVLVKYTYGGDANLDGKINVDDYTRIDFNVALGASGWFNGDFNYDGKINVDDYTIIDFNVGIQGSPIVSGAAAGAAASGTTAGLAELGGVPARVWLAGRRASVAGSSASVLDLLE